MTEVTQNIEKGLKNAYSYVEYEQLIEDLLKEGKSTTKGSDEMFVHYSELGIQRMKRWDKKFELTEEQTAKVRSYNEKRSWIVLAEGWCGDAAHSVPVMNKVAELSENIELKIVLRESNLYLMNDFLTDGGKSIPKLIVYNQEEKEVENTWGSRPSGAKEIFDANRAGEWEEMEKKLQTWYNKDKGKTTAAELMELLK
ncbi:MAG TPA: thioredoxin family protein [Chitinophagaceae bacterium]|nr:thioredoxin family protein [Chitinophagaceae bacterium]